MCIYIRFSMSIIEKVFKYEATELPVIKFEDEIWFKAVTVATILKYINHVVSTMLTPKPRENCQYWCPNLNGMNRSI